MWYAAIAAAGLCGLVAHAPGQPTLAPPERQECLLTWIHPDGTRLVHSVASIRRSVRCGEDVDRDPKVPWPAIVYCDEGGECQTELLSGAHCIRWTPLDELWQRARKEARKNGENR